MLQVEPYFRMALEALDSVKTGDALLEVPALPVLVATAQRDFLNSYHHALTHYLPISLKEPYLQNASIGSPYEKWLKFTNEDCEAFDYDFWMLLQNTSRLWHDIYMRNPSAVVKKGGHPIGEASITNRITSRLSYALENMIMKP